MTLTSTQLMSDLEYHTGEIFQTFRGTHNVFLCICSLKAVLSDWELGGGEWGRRGAAKLVLVLPVARSPGIRLGRIARSVPLNPSSESFLCSGSHSRGISHLHPLTSAGFCTLLVESELGGEGTAAAKVVATSRDTGTWKQVLDRRETDKSSRGAWSQAALGLRD